MISVEVQGPCDCVERFVRDFLQQRTTDEITVDYCGPNPPWNGGPFAAEILEGDSSEVRRLLDECFGLWRWSPDCPTMHCCGAHCSESRLIGIGEDVVVERECRVLHEGTVVSTLGSEDCRRILEDLADNLERIPFSFLMAFRPDDGGSDDPEFETVTIDLENVGLLINAAAPLMSARQRLEWRRRLHEASHDR